MLSTLAQSHFGPFVALFVTAAVMDAVCSAIENAAEYRWWYDEARATRRFFVIAGLLGIGSLAQGVDQAVAWTVAIVVAFGVDAVMELRQLSAKRR